MANQIVVSAGAKVRNLSGVLTATSGVVSFLPIDVSLGIPQLDVNGKILVSQLPNSVMEYKGTWSAATNTPTLANGTGNQGDVYLCNVAGTVDFGAGPIAFFVGDQVIYSGSIWQRASGATGTVTSVAVTESGDSLNITGSPITTSGTINIGFNGTNLQYVNGAGNLTTFPILTGYVTAVSGTAPVVSSGGTTPAISMAAATGSVDGYLSATDFAIFNAKQSALTFSSPLVNTSGTISIPAATTSVNGYLASADFTTFNNKQNAITLTTTGTSGASTFVGATLNIPNYGSALTGYVPYTGATANVDLGVFDLTADLITGATGSFASSGGSDTFAINHSSGSGIALNITKGGNGEGLYINKTSGSGNAATIVGTLNATTLVKSGGTSSQFLKADGTVDSNTYALDSLVVHLAGTETITGAKTFSGYTTFTSTVDITSGLTFSNSGFTLVLQPPTLSVNRTVTLPNGTGTLALTSDISYPVTSVFGRTGAVVATSGDYTTAQVTESGNLYFTDSRARLALSGSTGISYNNTTGVITNSAPDQVVALTASTGISVTGTYPNFTITNTSPSSGGTVTSVAALTIGTTGTDLSSTVANSTTNPVITLNVPTASAANRGALSSADWTTFNNKQGTITLTTTGTSGAATFSANTLNIPQYQGVLTNPVTGTGTTNTLPKFTGTSTIGNSVIQEASGSIGINVSPVADLQVGKASDVTFALSNSSSVISGNRGNIVWYNSSISSVAGIKATAVTDNVGTQLEFYTRPAAGSLTQVMTLNSTGNLGLGVTPSAWFSDRKVIQIQAGGSINGSASTFPFVELGANFFHGSLGDTYIGSSSASKYRQLSGGHEWYSAPSGTAGNAITFTQAMTLTAAGRLLIGTPTEASYMLDVNGTGRFSTTNNVLGTFQTTGGYSAIQFTGNGGTDWGVLTTYAGLIYFGKRNTGGTGADPNLTINTSTGAATFSSSVTATSLISLSASGAGAIFLKDGSAVNKWEIGHSANDLYFYNYTSATNPLVIKGSTGAATFSSSVTATSFFESSDSRLKTLIQDNYQTKGIASITPKLYTKNGKVELGYYAQDFVGILDSAVSKGSDDMLSLSYREVLVAKVYALEQEIKELKAKLN